MIFIDDNEIGLYKWSTKCGSESASDCDEHLCSAQLSDDVKESVSE